MVWEGEVLDLYVDVVEGFELEEEVFFICWKVLCLFMLLLVCLCCCGFLLVVIFFVD